MILEKEFEYLGYKCEVKINEQGGFRCGYVQLPESHPSYNERYCNLDIDCHGGLSYGRDGKFGFDCGHFMDGVDYDLIENEQTRNAMKAIHSFSEYEVRSLEYVEKELKNMCVQFRKLEEGEK
jgi:hypothetical protein